MLPYVCFPFLRWVKFFIVCFRQVFFHLGDKKSGRWSSYTVTIVWEFAWVDSVLVVLGRWSHYGVVV